VYDVAIVGGGPAGQSAAIFTSKAGLKTILIDNEKGLTKLALLKNYYGIEETSGDKLVETGRRQAERLGTEFVKAQAKNVIKSDGGFEIQTEDGPTYSAHQVILATGANANLAKAIGLKTKDGREKYVKTVIETDEAGHTAIKGIWVAGVAAGVSVHAIITSGDGAKTAINLISELKGERYTDHDKL
jgi:thioredoxin reductase